MKERPIIFSGPMVRAILDGRKTQTRRIVKPTKCRDIMCDMVPCEIAGEVNGESPDYRYSSYGKPGDRLWVRETWARYNTDQHSHDIAYRATQPADWPSDGNWRPSIFMPRALSRITLEITAVRVERLQDGEGETAFESRYLAEGVYRIDHGDGDYYYSAFRDEPDPHNWSDPADAFKELWQSIHGPGSWDANPWVWVIKFKRVEQ